MDEDLNTADLRKSLIGNDPNQGGFEPGSTAYELNKENYDLKNQAEEFKELAKIDPLTLIKNRRGLSDFVDKVRDSEQDFTVFMLDMDHFKGVNDTYGHDVGDETLKHIAEMLREEFRSTDGDTLVRYGGEEFLVIIPSGDKELAQKKAEELRKKFENEKFTADTQERSKIFSATGSIGISIGKGNELINIISQADKALYKAKNGDSDKNKGRNQWIFYNESLSDKPRQGFGDEN